MRSIRDPYTVRIAAGSIRIGVAAFALSALAPLISRVELLEPILFGYIGVASLFLVLIVLRIGDRPRAIAGGLVDMAMITFLVHALGSTSSVFVTIYIFAAMLNTLTVGPRVGFAIAALAALAYGGLLLAEQERWIAMAVRTDGTSAPLVNPVEALASWMLTAFLLLASTSIVGSLVALTDARTEELRAANARLFALTNRDPLTDLWNRRHLVERIEGAFGEAKRRRFALAVFDLDGFKQVNDRHGHLAGDALLSRIGRALANEAADRDVVCRFGGDEFVVMLLDVREDEAATRVEAMRIAVASTASEFLPDCRVTVSAGLAMCRADDDASSLMRRADDLAYRAKREGGNRVSRQLEGDRDGPGRIPANS